MNTGFFVGQIVTLHPLALPLFPHTLPALAAIALGFTSRRTIRLFPLRDKGLATGGTTIRYRGFTA